MRFNIQVLDLIYLRHVPISHGAVSVDDPPPVQGPMPSQVRVLVIVPIPQLTEHSDQSDQEDHAGHAFRRQILVSFESPSQI